MSITQGQTTSFKVELLQALHDFSVAGNTFKLALYTSAAALDADTTVYTTTEEVVGTGYVAGGNTLVNVAPVAVSGVAVVDFEDSSWAGASFTARGGLIYNSTNGDRAVAILNFGEDKTCSGQTFTVQFPEPTGAAAVVSIT